MDTLPEQERYSILRISIPAKPGVYVIRYDAAAERCRCANLRWNCPELFQSKTDS